MTKRGIDFTMRLGFSTMFAHDDHDNFVVIDRKRDSPRPTWLETNLITLKSQPVPFNEHHDSVLVRDLHLCALAIII